MIAGRALKMWQRVGEAVLGGKRDTKQLAQKNGGAATSAGRRQTHQGHRRETGDWTPVTVRPADRGDQALPAPRFTNRRTLADPQAAMHQPLSRRRPLSSTGTGAVDNELHGVGRYLAAAGPCDAAVDITAMSKTVKWRLPTSSSGASSSSRPSSLPPSLFSSSPCCPPSR